MQKLLLPAILLFISCSSYGQITLTATTSTPQPGDTIGFYSPYTIMAPGPSGANVTWGFSNLPITDRDTLYFSNDPSTICGDTADLFSRYNFTTYTPCNDYKPTIDSLTLFARRGGDYVPTYYYQDPEVLLPFPLTYNSPIFSDHIQFYSTQIGPGSFTTYVNGNQETTVDGYGTLELPEGTYSVLRIKKEYTYHEVAYHTMGPTTYYQQHMVAYEWYSDTASPMYLLRVIGQSITTDVNNIEVESKILSVYPNPAVNVVNVELPSGEIKETVIKDITGKVLPALTVFNGKSKCEIDVSSLAAGLYFVEMRTGNGSLTRKIQVR